ncbi:MAG: hypothetical protein EOO11_20275, partial [Chitinophagaceae bacterium]
MNRPLLLFLLLCSLGATAQPLAPKEAAADFEEFWNTVRTDYAYWNRKATDWNAVGARFRTGLDTVRDRRGFTLFLERALRELYDHHAGLNTNTAESYRLVPTGADVHAVFRGGRATVLEVRRGYGAEKAGLRAGAVIVAVNGVPVDEAIRPLLPRSLRHDDAAARRHPFYPAPLHAPGGFLGGQLVLLVCPLFADEAPHQRAGYGSVAATGRFAEVEHEAARVVHAVEHGVELRDEAVVAQAVVDADIADAAREALPFEEAVVGVGTDVPGAVGVKLQRLSCLQHGNPARHGVGAGKQQLQRIVARGRVVVAEAPGQQGADRLV